MKKFFKMVNQYRAFYLGQLIVSFILSTIIYEWITKEEILNFSLNKWILLVMNIVLLIFIVDDKL